MDLFVWALALYGRYAATVFVLGSAVALVVWLYFAIVSWSSRRLSSTREPSE